MKYAGGKESFPEFRTIGTRAGAENSDPRNGEEAVRQLLRLAPSYGLIIPPPQ